MVLATPGIRLGHRYPVDSPTPGASKLIVRLPRVTISRSKGSANSRLAASPVMISSGGPLPRVEVRSRTRSTSRNLMTASSGGVARWFGGWPVGSGEGADTGDIPSDDEGLDGLGALVGMQGLDVRQVPYHVVFEQNAIAAQKIPSFGDDLAGSAGVVHLGQRGDGVGESALLLQPGQLQAVQLHGAHLGEHPDQPLLDDLEPDQRLAELGALPGVGQGDVVSGGGVPERAPGDGVAGAGQHGAGVL